MGFIKGHKKVGGKVAGKPNNATIIGKERLETYGGEAEELHMAIIRNQLRCGVCRGNPEDPTTCKSRYKLKEEKECECLVRDGPDEGDYHADPDCWRCSGTGMAILGLRTCQSCNGTGMEACDPKTRQNSADSVYDRWKPKLKAIEHSGDPDNPIQHEHKVKFVD